MLLYRESTGSGTEFWDWNLNGDKCTYHALYPRAWTIYDGTSKNPQLLMQLKFFMIAGNLSFFVNQVNLTQISES